MLSGRRFCFSSFWFCSCFVFRPFGFGRVYCFVLLVLFLFCFSSFWFCSCFVLVLLVLFVFCFRPFSYRPFAFRPFGFVTCSCYTHTGATSCAVLMVLSSVPAGGRSRVAPRRHHLQWTVAEHLRRQRPYTSGHHAR